MSDPNVQTLAGYVLGAAEPGHVPPGDFYRLLVDTVFKADRINRIRLAAGFPTLVAMVAAYKDDPTGVDRLRHAEQTGEWS